MSTMRFTLTIMHWYIIGLSVTRADIPFWYDMMLPETTATTTQPSSTSTDNNIFTQSPDMINELGCNYGVNYTKSSDFYSSYIIDTCYDLNTRNTDPPLTVSLQYSCDYIHNTIDENIYFNNICGGQINHTRANYLQTNHCNPDKIGKQCSYLWLNSFDQHSHECSPHLHSIRKYAMILNECVLYETDMSAFKNIYTQTENNRRQIIQFQYLSMNDCIFDNITALNIDVTQSIADDIYDFISEECNNGYYYTVQPSEFEQITPSVTVIESVNTTAVDPMCNYRVSKDLYTDLYESVYVNGSDILCESVSVLQYYAMDENCSNESVSDMSELFVKEYAFIINACLEYNESVWIYNSVFGDWEIMRQFRFDSLEKCESERSDGMIEIMSEECDGVYYYEIVSDSSEGPFIPVWGSDSTNSSKYWEGFVSVEWTVVIVLCAVILWGICCAMMCWYARAKGYGSMFWNCLCCGRYNRLEESEMGINDVVEIGDNMEFAALSEHR